MSIIPSFFAPLSKSDLLTPDNFTRHWGLSRVSLLGWVPEFGAGSISGLTNRGQCAAVTVTLVNGSTL